MTRLIVGISCLALAAAAPALYVAQAAHAEDAASTNPASVKAGTYTVEPTHTQVAFTFSHMGFTNFTGSLSGGKGLLVLDPLHPARSSVQITVPISSLYTGVASFDADLKTPKYFDSTKFPEATFTSTSVVITGKTQATITGRLLLHGVSAPLTLQARLVGAGVDPFSKADTVGFEATGLIHRSVFGISFAEPMITDDMYLTIHAAFVLQH